MAIRIHHRIYKRKLQNFLNTEPCVNISHSAATSNQTKQSQYYQLSRCLLPGRISKARPRKAEFPVRLHLKQPLLLLSSLSPLPTLRVSIPSSPNSPAPTLVTTPAPFKKPNTRSVSQQLRCSSTRK